ncbi:MAG TPA: preprotein translocase subunit SecE [Candidatus Paceibacterota bacterium]
MRFIEYIRETKGEMKHVNWSSRKQVALFTFVIIAISIFTAAFLGFFDFFFTTLLERFVI